MHGVRFYRLFGWNSSWPAVDSPSRAAAAWAVGEIQRGSTACEGLGRREASQHHPMNAEQLEKLQAVLRQCATVSLAQAPAMTEQAAAPVRDAALSDTLLWVSYRI